ncbi:Hypothetical predicted protein [Paramuricea clavata]|uniref:Uncharacterized protein n=1 Tax=Paramuricea clavata TaxID=317549 RepID=A0A6S7IUZ2_PARCT|nr:Hypothetical predicted protein [Paramuricea clavata]
MIALKNKDDDEPTYTDNIRSQKSAQKRRKKPIRLSSTNPRRLLSKRNFGENNESPRPVKMCGSCTSKDETQLSSDRDKWPIGKIENGCFHQICSLLDLAVRSKEPLMSALDGFDQTTAAGIKTKYEAKGGLGTAEEVLGKWGSRNQENNVGALKKILKDTMQRDDVVIEIEKWENLRVCHGCGIKLNKPH